MNDIELVAAQKHPDGEHYTVISVTATKEKYVPIKLFDIFDTLSDANYYIAALVTAHKNYMWVTGIYTLDYDVTPLIGEVANIPYTPEQLKPTGMLDYINFLNAGSSTKEYLAEYAEKYVEYHLH